MTGSSSGGRASLGTAQQGRLMPSDILSSGRGGVESCLALPGRPRQRRSPRLGPFWALWRQRLHVILERGAASSLEIDEVRSPLILPSSSRSLSGA
eukprot:3033653-Pyramimonas_sp.AAC.1